MSKTATVLAEGTEQPEETMRIEAIAELDEAGSPIAAEILGFREQIGDAAAESVMLALREGRVSSSYDDVLDALTLSFGSAPKSFGQAPAIMHVAFRNARVERVTVTTK